MPRYLIERSVGQLTEEEWQAAGRKSNAVIAQLDGVVWIRSYISQAEGKVYCEFDAPSRDAVVEHARLAGMPADRISEISLEISPTMFM